MPRVARKKSDDSMSTLCPVVSVEYTCFSVTRIRTTKKKKRPQVSYCEKEEASPIHLLGCMIIYKSQRIHTYVFFT